MTDRQENHTRYYRGLTIQMIVIIIVVSVAPLLVISGAIRYYFEVSYREKVLEHLRVLIKKHRQNIDTFLFEKLGNILFLARSSTLPQLTNEGFLSERLKILQNAYGHSFVDLGVVNEQGIQIAYAGPFRLRNVDYSQAPWFQEALQSDTFISDVFPGLRGLPHFIVAVKIEEDGHPWILRATVDFEAFNSLVQGIRIGESGFAFVLNKRGEFQTKPHSEVDPKAEPYQTLLRGHVSPSKGENIEVQEVKDPSHTEYVYVTSWMKNGNWLLAFQQRSSDAYAALYAMRRVTILITVFGVVCIVGVAVVLSRRMVRYIMKADLEKEMLNERVIEAGKLASLGELAAGIAHEINNPVAVMVEEAGWLQDLLEEEEVKKLSILHEFKQSLNQIKTQGARCKQITHKLLSFARRTDPRPRPVNINELIRESVGLCHQRLRYGSVKIVMNLGSNLPPVYGSPSELQQVFMNLINNSLDAIENEAGTLEITSRATGDYVIVDVTDNGPGIPEANLPRIFDPFFTTKPVGKGTGLGLSICYGIVSKMGGRITVNSAVGVGTAFHIQLPVVQAQSVSGDTGSKEGVGVEAGDKHSGSGSHEDDRRNEGNA